jgi:hypothetical protein
VPEPLSPLTTSFKTMSSEVDKEALDPEEEETTVEDVSAGGDAAKKKKKKNKKKSSGGGTGEGEDGETAADSNVDLGLTSTKALSQVL